MIYDHHIGVLFPDNLLPSIYLHFALLGGHDIQGVFQLMRQGRRWRHICDSYWECGLWRFVVMEVGKGLELLPVPGGSTLGSGNGGIWSNCFGGLDMGGGDWGVDNGEGGRTGGCSGNIGIEGCVEGTLGSAILGLGRC